ncbi:hypothetical protein LC613_33425 [Nostoc sphaeroides CHAB 2801]|uniref:hypothetical protein n=1 Tax=Nostoc sphaeroides TaxID=446679 RepID=UPI001E2E0169|nr:hypothetical protein [Nostoc sphaeroides]MCC5632516.1 hypothetical protein [Nostoc sphaeroides CHAB 2801]
MSQDSEHKKEVAWQEALKVSMFVFIPAFVLIVVSFLFFNPAQVNVMRDLRREQVEKEVKKQLSEEIKQQVQEEVKIQVARERAKILDGQKALLNLDKESPLGRTYVTGEINKQAKEEAEKVIQDEINLVKGDLFSQIIFPVIFAIASIFAAFAVKDILIEVLKQQERDKIKKDIETILKTELKSKIVPKIFAEEKQKITKQVNELEGYVYWVEHQILNIFITEIINELKKGNLPQFEPEILSAIEKIHNRSIVTLEKSSIKFRRKDFQEIKSFEDSVVKIKLNSIALNQETKNTFISNFDESRQKGSEPEEVYQGQSIFHAQMGLLRITLSKLIEEENSAKIANLIKEVDQIISSDPYTEYQQSVDKNKKMLEENRPN